MTSRTARLFAGALAAWTVALATAAPVAAAQQPPAQGGAPAWLVARLDNRLDARTRAAVERVVDSVHAAGLPVDPLIDKALEGAAKRGSPEGIVRAVRALATRMAEASRMLGPGALEAELKSGAAALAVGVDPAALSRLRRDRPGQPLAVALGVMTDLISRQVPVDVATRNVLALTRAGAADEQLVAFRRDVERDIGVGAPPAVAASLRASGVVLNLSGNGTGSIPTRTGPAGPPPRQKP